MNCNLIVIAFFAINCNQIGPKPLVIAVGAVFVVGGAIAAGLTFMVVFTIIVARVMVFNIIC